MSKLSYQLYSSRNFGPLSDTLRMISDLGYAQAEGYGGLYASPEKVAALKDALSATGLEMPSGHFGLDQVESDPNGVIKITRQLGVSKVFVPHLMPDLRPDTIAGWHDFGARLSKAGAPLKDAGLSIGWHNHDFEFRVLEGAYPIDAILDGGPDLEFEFDVAWAVRAGEDPLNWISKLGDRIVAAHVKDIATAGECEDEDGWADVGHGTIDWSACMTALRRVGCELFVAEHDNPNDDARFARRSIATFNTL